MLKELRISNLAIIEDLTVRFEEGFNVLTGETGAGKSIIVDSLAFALGSRMQTESIRSGAREAVIEAFFEPKAEQNFPDLGIDTSNGVIIRRSFSVSGKNRAYINDSMVSMRTLAEVGKTLVDIHGQHEHQSLLSPENQMLYLDLFGKLQDYRASVSRQYREVAALRKEVSLLQMHWEDRARKLDLLRFQIQEIDAAGCRHGEDVQLEEQRKILCNLTKLRELALAACDLLYDADDSCVSKLAVALKKVREMRSIDVHASPVLSSLEAAVPLLDDAVNALRRFRDRYECEPAALDAVEERLAVIRKLEKKYGEGIEAILRYRDAAETEIKSLERADERKATLEHELERKEKQLAEEAASLSEKRRETAIRLQDVISRELSELAFDAADFRVDIRRKDMSPHGVDEVEFLFSANPGEPPKPLAKIASGGELSRVMLALKTAFADIDKIPVLVFDEIDAGIGGRTAEIVGRKLRYLSRKHQVLCTTHLPQLASKSTTHLTIEKKQRSGRVYVRLRELTGIERLQEIARMLSGTITESSLLHARELIESAA